MHMCIYHIFFISLSIDRHLVSFYILAIANNAATNMGVHTLFQVINFVFSEKILRCETTESYGSSVFNILVNTQTIFHSGCSNLYSSHSALGFSFLHIQANRCFCFLIIGILTGVRRYLFVCVYVCVSFSLIINYVGQPFMYLLAICMYFSLENENL